jgi:hypothetical protein
MEPPAGCRGAVTGWRQLADALERISAEPTIALQLQSRCGSSNGALFGGPAALLSALATNPTMLLGPAPPSEVYARFVWFAAKVSAAARVMGATLAQLPTLAVAAATPREAGALVEEVLVGPGGLKQTADTIAGLADDLVQVLEEIRQVPGGGLESALATFKAEGADLEQQAAAAAALKERELSQFQSAARAAAHHLRKTLEEFEVAAATVTAAAVVTNLRTSLTGMAAAWREAAVSLQSAVSGAPPEQLGSIEYLRDALDLDRGAKEWRAFADMVRAFIRQLLVVK